MDDANILSFQCSAILLVRSRLNHIAESALIGTDELTQSVVHGLAVVCKYEGRPLLLHISWASHCSTQRLRTQTRVHLHAHLLSDWNQRLEPAPVRRDTDLPHLATSGHHSKLSNNRASTVTSDSARTLTSHEECTGNLRFGCYLIRFQSVLF